MVLLIVLQDTYLTLKMNCFVKLSSKLIPIFICINTVFFLPKQMILCMVFQFEPSQKSKEGVGPHGHEHVRVCQ
jgi:hypothetical protein